MKALVIYEDYGAMVIRLPKGPLEVRTSAEIVGALLHTGGISIEACIASILGIENAVLKPARILQ
jgi:hypothetical protein